MTTLLDPADGSDVLGAGRADPPEPHRARSQLDFGEPGDGVSPPPSGADSPLPSVGRVAVLVGMWAAVVLTTVGLVAYGLGSVLEHRQQRTLLRDFRVQVDKAANAVQSLQGYRPPTLAPEVGAPVAIIDVGRLHLQQVVVEGAGSSQTEKGPGHVSGTAGPGQPGNSVIVGRKLGFGGPFNGLDELHKGDRIVITTPQGQSLYSIDSVSSAAPRRAMYGPTKDDRLTLLTSAGTLPGAGTANVVVAKMIGAPFAPTPQGGFSASTDGRHGDGSAWPLLALLGVGLAGTIVLTVTLYRRWRVLSTYLLTTPVLVALALLFAETLVRLLPAWS